MDIGQRGGLAAYGLGDAAVAMAQRGDGSTTRGINDAPTVGGDDVDALAAGRDRGNGTGTMKDAGHGEALPMGLRRV